MATASAPVVITTNKSQTALQKGIIDVINAYIYDNPTKKVKGITINFTGGTNEYSIGIDEEPIASPTAITPTSASA